MARINVYLPDDLASRVRAAGVNVSAVTRAALEEELSVAASTEWLSRLDRLTPIAVEHGDVLEAVYGAREELAGEDRA
jgi:post-segregation antitoxin (ccd killing protein)